MRLLLRHFTASVGASVLVAVVVLAVTTLVALAPRALSAMATAELRGQLERIAPELRDLTAEGVGRLVTPPFPVFVGQNEEDYEAEVQAWLALGTDERYRHMERALDGIRSAQAPVLRDLLGEPDYYALSEALAAPADDPQRDAPLVGVRIALDPDIEQRVHLVDGRFPAPFDPSGDGTAELMLSVASAEAAQWSVGESRDRAGQRVLLSGVFEAVDPDDPYWRHATSVLIPEVIDDGNSTPRVTAIAYQNPAVPFDTGSRVTVWYPFDVAGADFADAAALAPELRTFTDRPQAVPGIDGELGLSLGFGSRAEEVLESVLGRATTTTSVLAMVASGPLGVVLAVFALGARSVIERRRPALSLAAARGASGWQLRGAMALEGAVLGIVPAALGIAIAALLLPEPVGPDALLAPALLGLAPAVLFAVGASPSGLRATRADLGGAGAGRFRWIVEVLIVALAAVALLLLLRRGLTDSAGVDPLLAATPLLLSLAVCVGVLRLYPLPLAALGAGLRRRPGLTGFLGATRAIRDRSLALAAVLALVVGVSVSVFSGVLLATIDRGVAEGAAGAIGADLRADGPVFDEETVAAASGLPGVQVATGIDVAGPVALRVDNVRTTVQLFVADTAALGTVRGLPGGLDRADSDAIPIVLSSDVADAIEAGSELLLEGEPVAVATAADPSTGFGTASTWALVDVAFAEQLTGNRYLPRVLLVATGADADAAALERDLVELGGDGTTVTSLADAVADARATPTTAGLRAALLLSVLSIAVLAALAVVLSSAIGAESRNRIVGMLRTLGLSGRQSSALVAWELAPPAIVALLAGTLLGLALPWVVVAAVDLRPFTRAATQPAPTVDPLLLLGSLAAVLLAVILAAAVSILIARRRSPATTLRMGAE